MPLENSNKVTITKKYDHAVFSENWEIKEVVLKAIESYETQFATAQGWSSLHRAEGIL